MTHFEKMAHEKEVVRRPGSSSKDGSLGRVAAGCSYKHFVTEAHRSWASKLHFPPKTPGAQRPACCIATTSPRERPVDARNNMLCSAYLTCSEKDFFQGRRG